MKGMTSGVRVTVSDRGNEGRRLSALRPGTTRANQLRQSRCRSRPPQQPPPCSAPIVRIYDPDVYAVFKRDFWQTGRGIDPARSSHHQHEVCLLYLLDGECPFSFWQFLTKPHNTWTNVSIAVFAPRRVHGAIVGLEHTGVDQCRGLRCKGTATGQASRRKNTAMKMDNLRRAGMLMQVVHVLRQDGQILHPVLLFKRPQRDMPSIGHRPGNIEAP